MSRTRGPSLKSVQFSRWLEQQGCSLIPTTNEYELVRFECGRGIGVVYAGKRGYSFSSGWVDEAIECYMREKPWNSGTRKVKRSTNDKRKARLLERDGCECFFCGKTFPSNELTKEHLLSLSQGGPNTLANMVLACQPCNSEADSMPLHRKVELRDSKRSEAQS